MLDYLVVGLGLAGLSFCETLEREGKTYRIISDQSQQASMVASGLYNPVALKRFTLAWNAGPQLSLAIPFYRDMEMKLGLSIVHPMPVLRRFVSAYEQNQWFEAAEKPGLQPFLSTRLIPNNNPEIDAPLGFGQVLGTGRIDTAALLQAYEAHLLKKGLLIREHFDFKALVLGTRAIAYKSLTARRVVFATGYGLRNNPFFNYLPLSGTKGELLILRMPELKENRVLKSSVFITPLGTHHYSLGATYERYFESPFPTEEGKIQLLDALRIFVKCPFTLVAHRAGIRPSVPDRKPLLGRHPLHKELYVLNGMGSRGVLQAPYTSRLLWEFIEKGASLPPETDIARFGIPHRS